MLALVGLSWAGAIHKWMELPALGLTRPEFTIPTAISLLLLFAWLWLPDARRVWCRLIFAWALIHLAVGGVLFVHPLGIWPFVPEQSLEHYLSHGLYAALQLPLLWRTRAHFPFVTRLNPN
jgi:hypothetical protein